MILLAPIMISVIVVILFRYINKKYNPPIFGVYQQRNKYFWIKFVCMYFYLRARQLATYLKWVLAVELGYQHFDGTVHIQEDEVALEEMHPLDSGPKAIDAVYFNGVSKQGDAVVCGVARRPNNICDAFMYLKVAGEDLLLTPDLPDTYMEQSDEDVGKYKVNGISLRNFIPMRTWKISYKGEMKSKTNPEKRSNVDVTLTWSAYWQMFNFDIHMSPRSMAKDLAKEPWSKDYFKNLAKYHQTHYEQMGFLEGTVVINDKRHTVKIPCVRDHTVGKIREWRNFHRYVLHYMFLENGDAILVGCVSQPVILSHLTIGYMCRKSDQAVLPVKYSDFQMWQHGENQRLPRDYAFVFRAGGKRYDVKVQIFDDTSFYIGKVRESKFYERWGHVEVNGVKGVACAEWQFNNVAQPVV